jgi:predicted Zn-dependent protease
MSCRPEGTVVRVDKDSFSIEDQSKIGQTLSRHINQNPVQYPLYERSTYPEMYQYLDLLFETMVNTPQVENRSNFNWQVYVVRNKKSMTAYSLPGGIIYITDGFLTFLENEAQLFAVLSSEMYNTDQGAVMSLLQDNFSGLILGDIVFNNPVDELDEMISTLKLEHLSADNTKNADEFSVDIICPFQYAPDALASVFELEISDTDFPLEWTAIRESYDNRTEQIRSMSSDCGDENIIEANRYQERLISFLD